MKVKNENIQEVKTVRSDEEANELLSLGWVLMCSGFPRRVKASELPLPFFQLCRIEKIETKE
uniref:Uncharacterized protein n=1 Tax=viral metagenome TaxID=1070528 RepID=A0A6H1ZQT5_9ZZZZ